MAILKKDFVRWYSRHSMGSKMDVAWAAVKMAEDAEGVQKQSGEAPSAQQLKAEIAALVSKFDHSSIIDCNGDLVWLLKQLRQLSAV